MKKRILKIGYQEYTFSPGISDEDVLNCFEVLSKIQECNYNGVSSGVAPKITLTLTEILSNNDGVEDEL